MKHIKSYQLFESKEIISAGVENALKNNNLELFMELFNQYPEFIDYNTVVRYAYQKRHIFIGLLDIIPLEKVTHLFCPRTALSELDLSIYPNLKYLNCNYNQLSELDVSMLSQLNHCECLGNKLEELDFSNNPELRYLDCNVNKLSKLNVKGCISLRELFCSGNQLTELDCSGLTELDTLQCHENLLSMINVTGTSLTDDPNTSSFVYGSVLSKNIIGL